MSVACKAFLKLQLAEMVVLTICKQTFEIATVIVQVVSSSHLSVIAILMCKCWCMQ